jgi:hypothetical protein
VLTRHYGTWPTEIAAVEAEVKSVNNEALVMVIETERLTAQPSSELGVNFFMTYVRVSSRDERQAELNGYTP